MDPNSPKTNSENSVYRRLKQAVRRRYIKQGSQLVEITLARQMGVSRTPVRGAIKLLEAEGLVKTIPHRGAFVITPTQREIEETFRVRAQLEKMAVTLTIDSVNAEQLAELHAIIAMETAVINANDIDEYYAVNDSLHLKIAEFSGNSVLHGYIKEILDKTRIYLILYDPFYTLEYRPTNEHRAIIEAIAKGDRFAAEKAVDAHINSAVNGLGSAGKLPDDYLSL